LGGKWNTSFSEKNIDWRRRVKGILGEGRTDKKEENPGSKERDRKSRKGGTTRGHQEVSLPLPSKAQPLKKKKKKKKKTWRVQKRGGDRRRGRLRRSVWGRAELSLSTEREIS